MAAYFRDAVTLPHRSPASPVDLPVTTRRVGADSTTAEVVARPAVDRVLHVSYLAGAWRAHEDRRPWHTDTITARTTIAASLYVSFHAAVGEQLRHDARSRRVDKLASIFESRVDLERDLEHGDSLRVLVERQIDPAGTPHEGRIVAAALTVAGEPVEALQFRTSDAAPADTTGQYFDQFGTPLRAPFLRALELRHANGYVSRYGPPHLHFEMLLGGAQRDPRTALQTRAGIALPGRDRVVFQAIRERLLGPDRPAAVAAVRTSIAPGG